MEYQQQYANAIVVVYINATHLKERQRSYLIMQFKKGN